MPTACIYNAFACIYNTFACIYNTFACIYNTFACIYNTFACIYNTSACIYNTCACIYNTFACKLKHCGKILYGAGIKKPNPDAGICKPRHHAPWPRRRRHRALSRALAAPLFMTVPTAARSMQESLCVRPDQCRNHCVPWKWTFMGHTFIPPSPLYLAGGGYYC